MFVVGTGIFIELEMKQYASHYVRDAFLLGLRLHLQTLTLTAVRTGYEPTGRPDFLGSPAVPRPHDGRVQKGPADCRISFVANQPVLYGASAVHHPPPPSTKKPKPQKKLN